MNKATPAAKTRPATKPRAKVTRQLIVNPGVQMRMLLPIGVFAGAMAVLMYVLVFQPMAFDAQHDPSPMVRSLLAVRLVMLHAYFWPALGLAGLVAAIFVLIHSNHVAGPVYKLRVVLTQLADGKMMHIRFRSGDEFREFEDIINKLGKRMEILSSGTLLQATFFKKRLTWLKSRLETQRMETSEICMELDAALKDAGMDHFQMKDG